MYGTNAYVYAALRRLREDATLFPNEVHRFDNIRIMPDDRPHPGCGVAFIGIRSGNQASDKNTLLKLSSRHEVLIAVTLRTTVAMTPDIGEKFYIREDNKVDFTASMDAVCSHIVGLLHNDNTTINYAQLRLTEWEPNSIDPVTSPLFYKQITPIKVVGNEHFTEEADNLDVRQNTGLLAVITMGDGERLA